MICAEEVSFRIGDFNLRQVSLELDKGEYFVLLGPPGAGKSIFLECLCGLKRIDSGRVFIDGQEVTRLEPRQRQIGYVPQDYALFPHLSVRGNIGFALRGDRGTRVAEVAGALGISHLLNRSIAGLSGGERQRVALARALVMQPKVLFLDEPVSTLDEATRKSICGRLSRLPDEFGVTIIHVSHLLEEAFSVAGRAGIIHHGGFQQTGTLGDLLRKPANEFVARFMCCENIFNGRVIAAGGPPGSTRVQVGSAEGVAHGDGKKQRGKKSGRSRRLCAR